MRIAASCLVGAFLLLWTTAASAIPPTPGNVSRPADKVPQATSVLPDPIYVDVGGDTIATATVIPGLPYTDSGNTASYASNYESCVGCFYCPYPHVGARDVVYSFTPAYNTWITVDLCGSAYDTKVYIGDGGVSPVIACDDDGCPSSLYRSIIEGAHLLAGHTYYIFVDGWSASDAGAYTMNILPWNPCTTPCPPGSTAEGEPDCYDGYYDSYNAGCNSAPPTFTNIGDCRAYPYWQDIVICGTYGVYSYGGLTYRDTDWYQISLTEPTTITWCGRGEADTIVGVIDGRSGCPVTSFYDYNYGGCQGLWCVTDNLPVGTWWLFVSTTGWDTNWVCGSNYVATLGGYACGEEPFGIEPTSWGEVKSLYRQHPLLRPTCLRQEAEGRGESSGPPRVQISRPRIAESTWSPLASETSAWRSRSGVVNSDSIGA